jgi:hypothetical protein
VKRGRLARSGSCAGGEGVRARVRGDARQLGVTQAARYSTVTVAVTSALAAMGVAALASPLRTPP